MKLIQPAYQNKIDVAEYLAALGCRAVTISAVAKTVAADARDIYKRVNNTLSPSGQTPKDHQWFLQNQQRRQHGAFLLLMYCKFRTGLEETAKHDAHGLAFALTLKIYRDVFKLAAGEELLVSPERFSLLVTNGYQFGWREIIRGKTSSFRSDNVKIMKCRKCKMPHLTEAHYVSYECPNHIEE
jgi:hypothetical protein